MGQKVMIRFWWEFGLSSVFRNHLTTFCRPFAHYAWFCSAIVHFIQNNFLYFVCYGWERECWPHWLQYQFLEHDRIVARAQKTAVVDIEALGHLIMSQQGKKKTKSLLDFYT